VRDFFAALGVIYHFNDEHPPVLIEGESNRAARVGSLRLFQMETFFALNVLIASLGSTAGKEADHSS